MQHQSLWKPTFAPMSKAFYLVTFMSHLYALTMQKWLFNPFRNVWWLLNVSFKSQQIEGFWVKHHCTLRPSHVQTADPAVWDQLYNFWHHRNEATTPNGDSDHSLWKNWVAASKPDCYHFTITLRDDRKWSSPQSRAWHFLLSRHLHCRLSSAFKTKGHAQSSSKQQPPFLSCRNALLKIQRDI